MPNTRLAWRSYSAASSHGSGPALGSDGCLGGSSCVMSSCSNRNATLWRLRSWCGLLSDPLPRGRSATTRTLFSQAVPACFLGSRDVPRPFRASVEPPLALCSFARYGEAWRPPAARVRDARSSGVTSRSGCWRGPSRAPRQAPASSSRSSASRASGRRGCWRSSLPGRPCPTRVCCGAVARSTKDSPRTGRGCRSCVGSSSAAPRRPSRTRW